MNTVTKLKVLKNIKSAQKNRVWTLTIPDQTQLQNFPSSGRMNYNKTLSVFLILQRNRKYFSSTSLAACFDTG